MVCSLVRSVCGGSVCTGSWSVSGKGQWYDSLAPSQDGVFVSLVQPSVGEDVLEMAAALFQYSGEQGDTNALYTYAQLLRTGTWCISPSTVPPSVPSSGQGTETDLSQATQLFSDLAMKGHPYAQFALAGMYYTGSGVEQNFTRAYSLYSVASQNYVAEAFNVLGESVYALWYIPPSSLPPQAPCISMDRGLRKTWRRLSNTTHQEQSWVSGTRLTVRGTAIILCVQVTLWHTCL